jgi:hypothetical protein
MRLWIVLALLLASQSPQHRVEINSDTRRIAQDKLDELKRSGDPRSGRAAAAFRDARLDEPIYYYEAEAGFGSFAADSSNDLMPYLGWRSVIFPVVTGNDAIGILLFKTSLGSTCYFAPAPPGIYQQYENASRRVRLDRDQVLSVATAGGGDYLIVEDGTTIYRIAPCTTRTLLLLGLNDQHIEDLKFLTPKEMGPMIKRALRGGE